MTATLVFNADLGNYSDALGSAQRLSNGDYSFDSGRQGAAPNQIAQSIEVRTDGSKAYVLRSTSAEFRSFRIRTLYEGVSDQLAGDGGGEKCRDGDDSRGRWRMEWASMGRPRRHFLATLKGFSDHFSPGITAALNGPAGPPAIPAAFAVAGSISPIEAPPAPAGNPHADPAYPDAPAVAAVAARDILFADPGNDGWGERPDDNLARSLNP